MRMPAHPSNYSQPKKLVKNIILAMMLPSVSALMPLAHGASVPFAEDAEYHASRALDLINAADAYRLGYTGRGIIVGEWDERINFKSKEFEGKSQSSDVSTPGSVDWTEEDHGTHVAGLIAASRNGVGMQGVAFDADIRGYR